MNSQTIRPFDDAMNDVAPFGSQHPLDTGVTAAFSAMADEASNPASNLMADDEDASATDQRVFGVPGMSLGSGAWRTVPTYSE
jgi:hypothetical protein